MSKGNMLLGHARGKVGSLVFARANGQQITRAKADVVKNPQTESQTIQRIILNTVSQAYSKMSAIVDHSFEGVQPGQASMSFFMRRNMDNLRKYVAQQIAAGAFNDEIFSFSPLKSNIFVPNNYVVSEGKLPEIAVLQGNADGTLDIALAENSYQGVINQYGLKRGDQLTFVGIIGNSNRQLTFAFARVILDPTTAEGTQADITSAFVANGAINLPSLRNEGEFASLTFADGKLTFGLGTNYLHAAAVIVSRKSDSGDTWLRSNATMVANQNSAELEFSLGYCLDLFKSGDISTLSSLYLNNSGAGMLINQGITVVPSITSLTFEGNTIQRGGVALYEDAQDETTEIFSFVAGVENASEGECYLALANNGTPTDKKIQITGDSVTLRCSFNQLRASNALVLLQGNTIVDTYCSVSYGN